MENRFVEVMVNNPLKEKKAGTADSEIIVNWKDFSIFVNDPQQISLLAELMQKLEKMKFQWPKDSQMTREISAKQVELLLEGLEIEQKKAHQDIKISKENLLGKYVPSSN